jgi:hypothetical protein
MVAPPGRSARDRDKAYAGLIKVFHGLEGNGGDSAVMGDGIVYIREKMCDPGSFI